MDRIKINRKNLVTFFLIVSITAFTRIVFSPVGSAGLSYDDGSYALAVQSYSIEDTRPHLPGYFLHIKLIKLFSLLTNDAFEAMFYLSWIYSGLTAGFFYLLLKKWLRTFEALLLDSIIITNPFVWYFGCSTEIYSFDLFFSVLLIYLGLSGKLIYLLPFVFTAAAGVRQTSPVLLFPLYSFLWINFYRTHLFSLKKFVIVHLAAVPLFLSWFLPMTISAGGLLSYLNLFNTDYPVDDLTLLQNWYRFFSYLIFILIPIIISVIILLLIKFVSQNDNRSRYAILMDKYKLFIWLLFWWVVPPTIFFLFFHYSKGYYMLCVAGLISALLFIVHGGKTRQYIFSGIIIFQVLFFLFMPYKQPDVEIYFACRVRKMNFLQIWIERTRSIFLMTQSNLRQFQIYTDVVNRTSKLIPSSGDQPLYRNTGLVIDPTRKITTRSLQAKFPKIPFASFSLKKPDYYSIHKGMNNFDYRDTSNLFKSSIVLTQTDFFKRYLRSIADRKKAFGEWTAFTVEDKNSQRVACLYDSLFSRPEY